MTSLPATGLAALLMIYTPTAGSDRAARVRAVEDEVIRAFNQDAGRAEKMVPAFQDRMLAIAEEESDDPAARDALIWVVGHGGVSPAAGKRAARAAELLVEYHIGHPDLKYACDRIAALTDPPDRPVRLLKTIRAHSPHAATRGAALLAMARVLVTRGNSTPDRANREGLYGEAESCLEEVRVKYPDLRLRDRADRYVEQADRLLYEVRHLSVGRTAPEVEGETFDGKPFRLSGYRGRVVLLVFGKAGCPGCVALYPRQRDLLGRMAGRPFAVVGVHGGEEAERPAARASLAEHRVDWPVVWSPGPDGRGAVEARWNIDCYPTVYLLDANGVIRLKAFGPPGEKALAAAVVDLVKEAETRTGKP